LPQATRPDFAGGEHDVWSNLDEPMKTNDKCPSASPKASSLTRKDWLKDVRPILTEDAPGLGYSGKELPSISQLNPRLTSSNKPYGLPKLSKK
jgi:hypothetical protein